MKWLGLTGGIASGKSTVSKMLRENGIPVVDADVIAHEVVQIGSSGLKSVVTNFGPDILLPDGNLDRRALAQKVFGNPTELARLESILHPLIRAEVQARRTQLEAKNEALAFYDIPLLFETKSQSQFDAVVVVSCTPEQQKERLRKRQQWSEDEIETRIASQIPLKFKEKEADFVIHNDQDEVKLKNEMERLLQWLKTKA